MIIQRTLVSGAVLCLAFAAGCATGQIEVVKDDFKNTSMVKMELEYSAKSYTSMANAVYTREFAAGKKGPVVVHYTFTTDAEYPNLESKCIFKIGDKTFDAAFGDISGEIHTEISQQKTTTYQANDEGFVDFTKGNTAVTGISASSDKVFRAKLELSAAAEKEILAASKISMRIYFGTNDSTYEIDGSDLQKIKNFILSTPEKTVR